MPEPPLTPPDPPPGRRTPFEWSLGSLRPADVDVARPSFMYKAGQASRTRQVRFWQCVSAGLAVLMVVGGVAGYGLMNANRQQAVMEETRAQTALPRPERVTPPSVPEQPVPPEPPYTPTARSASPVPELEPTDEPTPAAIAAALVRRRDILVGGLGLVPDPRPKFPSEPGWSQPLSPGVFATPKTDRKPADDPPSPPEPR